MNIGFEQPDKQRGERLTVPLLLASFGYEIGHMYSFQAPYLGEEKTKNGGSLQNSRSLFCFGLKRPS
jgi:hypothetical protein